MAERYPLRPDQRSGAPGGNAPESDPLAELARLIGQTDPFSAMGRANVKAVNPAPRAEPSYSQDQAAEPAFEDDNRPAWLRNLPQYRGEQEAPDQHAAGGFDAHTETGWHQPQQDPSRYDEVLYGQGQDQQGQYPQQGYPQDAYAQEQFAPAQHDPYNQPAPGFPPAGQQGQYDPYQRDAYPYRTEEEEPVEVDKRRAGIVTAVVVLGFAVVGTAGAFAFKSYVMSPRSGEPPVIRADASPTKVAPAGVADPSGKINDRVSGTSERLVPREEQPVDVRDQTKARVVLPQSNQSPFPPNANASAAAPGPGDEPKKLKTVTIKGGNVVSPTPAVTPSPGAMSAPPAKRVATTPATPAPATPPPAARSVTPTPPPASSTSTGGRLSNPPDNNLPLPITPGAQSSGAAVNAQNNARVAAVQPAARTPEPTASGGYVVQLSSQTTETEARNSFRAIQTKFPDVMGGRQLIIKPMDFGAKGRWYRAQTGPFASSEDASDFCKRLTAAGGTCIVQRN